jgi:epoxyqueuosine reductase
MTGNMKDILIKKSQEMEVSLLGVANVERWEDPLSAVKIPEEFCPRSLFPEARSVIVIGLPIHLPVLVTSPSIWYRELYTTVNLLLDQYTYRLATFLNGQEYPSVPIPRDGYAGIESLLKNPIAFFSHRHAAYFAGLGTFGVNNMLLTPKYGPRVRFGSILTEADISPDPIRTEQICTRCMHCVEFCPSRALNEGEYPATLTDKQACAQYSADLNRKGISPCGVCIKVCPTGEDRSHYHRNDTSLYRNKANHEIYHRAWDHVRKYGSR